MITGPDKVGAYTYGHRNIRVKRWDNSVNPHCKVTIGKFCSIADNIEIITNGNHKYNRVSTFPFAELGWIELNNDTCSSYGNGDVNIGNDVWIAENVKIMSGITIGDGSIIACNTVVVKNVEPYSIVGGNPGKLIKFRFEKETIEKLLQIKWWDWDDNKIKQALPLILKDDQCKVFIQHYI